MAELRKVWTIRAKAQLKAIYENYKVNSLQSAKALKDEMLQATKDLHFAEQYQRDEMEPEFRRIIVKQYKLLYIEEDGIIFIARILTPDKIQINKRNKIKEQQCSFFFCPKSNSLATQFRIYQ
jgi:plasmid stabilization system protein ParE